MSIFPAYTSINIQDSENSDEGKDFSWLQNLSCPPEIDILGDADSPQKSCEISQGSRLSLKSNSDVSDLTASQTLHPRSRRQSSSSSSNSSNHSHKSRKLHKKHKKHRKRSSLRSHNRGEDSHLKLKKKRKRSRSCSPQYDSRISRKKHSKKKKHKSKQKASKRLRSLSRDKESQRYQSQKSSIEESFQMFKATTLAIVEKSRSAFLDSLLGIIKPEEAFYLCTYGDQSNVALSATQITLVPKYSKKKKILGSIHSHKKGDKKSQRYFSKSAKLHLLQQSQQIKSLEEKTDESASSNFIGLNLSWQEEAKYLQLQLRESGFGTLDSAIEKYSFYRNSPSQVEEKEGTSEKEDPEAEYWRKRVKDYNEKLSKNSTNVDLWMEFVQIHDKAFIYLFQDDKPGEDISKKKIKVLKLRELAERKISILDSALKKNPRSLALHLERIKNGEIVWENTHLRKEWDKLIYSFSNNLNVWCHSLIFHQTFSPLFILSSTIKSFTKCIQTLIQIQDGSFLTSNPSKNMGYQLIQLAKEVAFVWYQGGYLERSIALFQALIELNLYCPTRLKGQEIERQSKFILFEAFWDSRAPRFGEKDSLGWANYMETKKPVTFPEIVLGGMQDEEDKILADGGPNSSLWISLESYREECHWLPWEQDPDDCEDLERIVQFDEIKDCLFLLDSEEDLIHLLKEFVSFLGISISDDSVPLKKDLRLEFFKENLISKHFENLQIEALDIRWLNDISSSGGNPDDLFCFPAAGPTVDKNECNDYFLFISNVIKQAMDFVPGSYKPLFVVLFIRLLKQKYMNEGSLSDFPPSNLSSCRKQIKKLLKNDAFRNNIDLYYEFALFEYSGNSLTDASKISYMVLSSTEVSFDEFFVNEEADICILRHLELFVKVQVLQEIQDQNMIHTNNVLSGLTSFIVGSQFATTDTIPNGSILLRTKKKLEDIVECEFNRILSNKKMNYSLCFAIYFLSIIELLMYGFKPACKLIEDCISKARDINSELKNATLTKNLGKFISDLYEKYLWLIQTAPSLKNLKSFSPMTLHSLREILKDALRFSPTNETFLRLAAEKQSWRDLLKVQNFDSNRPAVEFIYKLLPHIRKIINFISLNNIDGSISCGRQMESILEAAVVSPNGKSCPLLWRLYLRLINVSRPHLTKEIAVRALNSCPGVKCLYLDCIRLVPEMLEDIIKLMMEKGIRVRLPLEELALLLENEEPEDVTTKAERDD